MIGLAEHSSVPKHECTRASSGVSPDEHLEADHFKQFGKVNDMAECIKKCCDGEHCDLAMMSYGGQNCYGVACYSENLCQMLPSYPTRISFDVSHVTRRAAEDESPVERLRVH